MDIDDFYYMDEMERYEAVRDFGVLIAERSDEVFSYKLFQIDNFYVENGFHREIERTTKQIAFTAEDDDFINPYLDQLGL